MIIPYRVSVLLKYFGLFLAKNLGAMSEKLFQDVHQLVGPDEQLVELNNLTGEGQVIGLYFSAHWCPPCRLVLILFTVLPPLPAPTPCPHSLPPLPAPTPCPHSLPPLPAPTPCPHSLPPLPAPTPCPFGNPCISKVNNPVS